MYRFYSAANLHEAHLILHLLDLAGIEARVFNEHALGATGEIPFTHSYPELWLADARDLTRAREIVRAYEQPAATETRACPACGEENPANFELCWRCGDALEPPASPEP